MLGERGLWFKMSFFEGSARIPLMLAGPGLGSGRVDTPVSALDILPTLLELAGIDAEADAGLLDGDSVLPLASRSEEHTSELQSLMRHSYAVFCLNKKIIPHIPQP